MKIAAMTALVVMAGGAAQADEPGQAEARTLTVCMASDVAIGVGFRAREMASEMFAGIGVKLDWRHNCPPEGIQINLSDHKLAGRMPDAFAYALPYEGTHIVVFYDRVQAASEPSQRPVLLAHVLVHEITHILQGDPRHSAAGIMKANWDGHDYASMTRKPLVFTSEDIELIYDGLARRAAHSSVVNRDNRATSSTTMH